MNTNMLKELGFKEEEMTPGTVLIREGSDNRNVYVLISGKVGVTQRGNRIAETDQPGTVLGQVAVLLGMPPVATSTVLEPSSFFVLPNFVDFLGDHAEAALDVAQVLAAQLVSSVNHLVLIKEQLSELQQTIESYVPAFGRLERESGPSPGEM
jgi:CRP-like cAMP-binding protein